MNKRTPSATPLQRASAPPLRAAASRPPPRVQRGRGAAFLGRHWARATRMLRSLLTRRGRQSHWRSRRTTGRRRRRLCAATRMSTSEDPRPEQPLPRGRTRVQRAYSYSSDSRPACECRVCSGARYSSFLLCLCACIKITRDRCSSVPVFLLGSLSISLPADRHSARRAAGPRARDAAAEQRECSQKERRHWQ